MLGCGNSDDMSSERPAGVVVVLCLFASLLFVGPAGALPSPDAGVTVARDVVYRTIDGEQLRLDAYVPTVKTRKRPAILLVHGGSWREGDKSNFTKEGVKLAQLGYVAFSINYRLAPAHPFPAAVDDVQAAVGWVRGPAQVKTYKLDPKRVGALGASAGGQLVGMLATLGQGSLTSGSRIKAAVSWSGPMDFNLWSVATLAANPYAVAVLEFLDCTPDQPSCANAIAASPISHVDRTDAPMLLANSEQEFVGLDHATRMDAALQDAGVPDQLVVFQGNRHAQGYDDDIFAQTVAFLQRYVGKPPIAKAG
jgi:acetyl esterase/lipase